MADWEDRLRSICLALPQACERETWGRPTYRVRDRIFAMPREHDGRGSVWLKVPEGMQALLIDSDPCCFFSPPYVGPKGWVGVVVEDVGSGQPQWCEVEAMVKRSYGLIAPKGLSRRLAG